MNNNEYLDDFNGEDDYRIFEVEPAVKYKHQYDEDACCIKCGFDGAEWSHWKHHTYEGKASDEKYPICPL